MLSKENPKENIGKLILTIGYPWIESHQYQIGIVLDTYSLDTDIKYKLFIFSQKEAVGALRRHFHYITPKKLI